MDSHHHRRAHLHLPLGPVPGFRVAAGHSYRPPRKHPRNIELLGIDVFICTADSKKEPTVEVMNTVLSAMALDYPPEKLAVYLSDDGGSPLTLYAVKEACLFGRSWIPFCRGYGIKTRCPEQYFESLGDDDERVVWSDQFKEEEEEIKVGQRI
ncbi:unnamed protein product [Camellia sinensis]